MLYGSKKYQDAVTKIGRRTGLGLSLTGELDNEIRLESDKKLRYAHGKTLEGLSEEELQRRLYRSVILNPTQEFLDAAHIFDEEALEGSDNDDEAYAEH